MNNPVQRNKPPSFQVHSGFALVVTLTLMILLTVIAVGLLSLSSISIRSNLQGSAQAEARANTRLALMIALGELQKEMGPDMRVSAESALFDSDKDTEVIDGVSQSHWLASYNSWGDWLNAVYKGPNPDGTTATAAPTDTIASTYGPRREKMFRRWLLSLPESLQKDITAPDSLATWNDSNSVVLVGAGSLGTGSRRDQVTRAYLTSVGKSGRHAWWIGPENHKARIDMAKKPRTLNPDAWQTAQGDTAEVGVGGLTGFATLDSDASLASKLITTQTLTQAQVTAADVQKHFFDLTDRSQGVLASVRSGHLKKDLSLLFEQDNAALPKAYNFNSATDTREPSIRPMSPDLASKTPKIPGRYFQSWTNMRHFYRMYRQNSDATVKPYAASSVTNSGGGLGVRVR